MRRAIYIFAAVGLAILVIGCQKTVREPGEPEHGGVFLHAAAPAPAQK
jgi:hypothetical protein